LLGSNSEQGPGKENGKRWKCNIAGEGLGGGNKLSARIVPLEQAEFYHFGNNADLLRSTSLLHNRVMDQREIWHKKIKPNPDIFVQNSKTNISFDGSNSSIWIENSDIHDGWRLHDHHIITGVPENKWKIELKAGICLDFVPVEKNKLCIRPYGFDDTFRGKATDGSTRWLNRPMGKWFAERNFSSGEIRSICNQDIYDCNIFPVLGKDEICEGFLQWIIEGEWDVKLGERYKKLWLKSKRFSASEIIKNENLSRLAELRKIKIKKSLLALARNHQQSIFYQLDLKQAAKEFRTRKLKLPEEPGKGEELMNRIHDLMFRSAYYENKKNKKSKAFSDQTFTLLRKGMLENLRNCKLRPVMSVKKDQILWGRSPLRLDLAGGWTDTPPY